MLTRTLAFAACLAASALGTPPMNDLWNPVADPRAQVASSDGKARFTVLTDRLIRMEWSPSGRFEDRASQAFVNRRLEVPSFQVERLAGSLRITTERVRLFFSEDGKAFHPGNLRVELAAADRPALWTPGAPDDANLGGTIRTLDMVDGRCDIEKGLLSRDGWALVDDSARLVFDPPQQATAREPGVRELEWHWLTTRDGSVTQDWYLFAYGLDYRAALRDFTKVAGRVPMPPRYVFGSWWSRYWAYSDEDLKKLVHEFREHDVPLDVLVIDMDWHLDGWTGYTWSPKFFPDPSGFLRWTDTHGLQITLNLHPADGVGPHEAMFPDMCRAMGLDPQSTQHVPFDCTDRRFMAAYFELLHWPIEQQGVDFWWMDWQQGTKTATPGLDPLWWLNHLHWEDLERRADPANDPTGVRHGRRPLVFSRWGGLGNHRYPIGFSGDTFSTWSSLAWQPEFTATAGNVGYGYWSHDIGGHQPGPVEPELYTRWVQFAVFSPVLRTHTSKNPQGERRIWASPEREFKAMREAFLLRYRLIPYIYSAARRCYDEALPLCRPLYYHWPELAQAYEHPNQYMFGDDLLAAPVCAAGDSTSRCAAMNVWLPPGTWTHWFTGETLEGPRSVALHVPLDEIPIFARGGAITPQAPKMRWSNEKPLDPLTLVVWPGGDAAHEYQNEQGCGWLYEDDGEGAGYERGQYATTSFASQRQGETLRVIIHAAEGSFHGMLEHRAYEVRVVDRWPAEAVRVDGRALQRVDPADVGAEGYFYDEAKLTIVVRLRSASVRERREIDVTLSSASESLLRAGLHGKLKLLDRVASMLDGHVPADLRDMAGLRRRIIESRGTTPGVAVLGAEERWRLASEIARGGSAAKFKAEAICRLLGLSCSIDVSSDDAEPGVLETRASALMVTPHHAIAGLAASLSITPSRPWAARPGGVRTSGDLQAGGMIARTRWDAPAPLQMTSLRAELTLRRAAETIALHFDHTVLPSINGWWVVGPFACPIERAMATPFAPETSADPARTYVNSAGKTLAWRRADRAVRPSDDPAREFVVDLHAALDCKDDDAVAYAMTYLHAPRATSAQLALGSDDGVCVWLNGEKIHVNDVQRGYGSKQDFVPVRLREGSNTLLLKITQAKGGWAFGAHLLHDDGSPMTEVEVRDTP